MAKTTDTAQPVKTNDTAVSSKKKSLIIAVLAVLGVGLVIILAIVFNDSSSSKPKLDVTAEAYLTNFSRLGDQHIDLLQKSLTANAKGSASDAASTRAALDANQKDLSAELAKVYGPSISADFNKAWKSYLDQITAYAKPDAKRDEENALYAQAQLRRDFGAGYIETLRKVNPKLNVTVLQSSMNIYSLDATQAISDGAENGVIDSKVYELAAGDLKQIFIYTAKSVTNQHPDYFKETAK